MISPNFIRQLLTFLLYLLAQVTIFRHMVLFDKAFCWFYLAFILLLPIETGRLSLLILGFLTGFVIDIFYDSLGIHAAATVFIAFLRPVWLNLITPRGGYENVTIPGIRDLSFRWFMAYALPLIFLHQMVLYFVEAGGFHLFFFTMSKVIASTIFTFIVITLVQYLFYRRSRVL